MLNMFRIILAVVLGIVCTIHPTTCQSDLNGFNPAIQVSQQPPAAEPPGGTTTTPSPAFRACFSSCRTVQNYNPVCGSDGISYDNEFRLQCARRCGQQVQMVRGGTCAGL